MTHEHIQLPFSSGSLDKETFSSDTEVASVFCLAENRRKKKGFLRSSEEQLVFLLKINYPIYVMKSCIQIQKVFRQRSILLDGLGSISENVLDRTIIDLEQFKKELSTISKVGPLRAFLTRHAMTFSNFKGSRSVLINNIISKQMLLSEMIDFIQKTEQKQRKVTKDHPATMIRGVNNQEIDQTVSVFNDLIDKVETGLGSLENLNKCLRSSTDRAKQKILEDKQKDFEKFNEKFENLKPIVKDKIEAMRNKHEEDIQDLTETKNKESERIYEKKDIYEKNLKKMNRIVDELNAEKKALSLRGDNVGEKYWSEESTKSKDTTTDLMKAIKTASEKIEKIQFRFDASLKRLNEKSEKEIRIEEERLSDIETKRDTESDMKDKIINELEYRNLLITSQISKLFTSKEKDKSKLIEMTSSWNPENNCVILVPLYLAKYENGNKTRYEVFAPAIVKSYASFKKVRRAFTGLESKLLHLRTPVGPHFEEFFTKSFKNSITPDKIFEDASTNLFKESGQGRGKIFGNGLDTLKKDGWLGNQEYKKMMMGLNLAFKLATPGDPDFELEESKNPSQK